MATSGVYSRSDEEEDFSNTSGPSYATGTSKKKKRRKKGFDLETCSEVTPVISNRRRKKKNGESSSKKESQGEIDYGQLVVDSRSSNDANLQRSESVRYELPGSMSNSTDDHNSNDLDEPLVNTSTRNRDGDNDVSSNLADIDEEEGGNTNESNLNVRELSNSRLQSANAIVLDHIWLPFFVCLFSTTRFILSTTASLSCRFIKIDIGFVPKNVNFMRQDVFASPWAFHDGKKCLGYPQDFTSEYINGNYSWRIARFAAIVNMSLGSIVFLIASFVVICRVMRLYPVSARTTSRLDGFDKKWESMVFIFVILMFIAEVLKFVFWGINLCTEDVWLTQDSNLQTAIGGCSLASGARCSVSALAFDLITIMTLTIGSGTLRNSLSACCAGILCCALCRKKDSEPVNTEEEGDSEPRYFFEDPNGNNDGSTTEGTDRATDKENDEKKEIKEEIKRSEESDQENSMVSNGSASKSKDPEQSDGDNGSEAYSDSSHSHEVEDSSDEDMTVLGGRASSRGKQSTSSSDMIDLFDS